MGELGGSMTTVESHMASLEASGGGLQRICLSKAVLGLKLGGRGREGVLPPLGIPANRPWKSRRLQVKV